MQFAKKSRGPLHPSWRPYRTGEYHEELMVNICLCLNPVNIDQTPTRKHQLCCVLGNEVGVGINVPLKALRSPEGAGWSSPQGSKASWGTGSHTNRAAAPRMLFLPRLALFLFLFNYSDIVDVSECL